MIDLHCHLLPGVDDGSSSIEESLEMARHMIADGVTHVVATPHFNPGMRVARPCVLRGVEELAEALSRARVPLTVLPGSEVQVTNPRVYREEFEAGEFCHLGDGDAFTLLEFSWNEARYPDGAAELMRWLGSRGFTPIVAHPERQDWARDEARVQALVAAGAWIQINVDSLLGANGPEACQAAEGLLRRYDNVVLATDSHNCYRCPGVSPGLDFIRSKLGAARAEDVANRAGRVLAALVGG